MSPRKRRLFASASVLAMAVVITALLATDEEAPSTPTITGAIPPPRAASANRVLPPATAFASIAQHPLFLPGRRPEPQTPVPRIVTEPRVQPVVAPSLSATLVGILMSPAGNSAILRLSDGKTTVIPEGGTIQGWALKQVLPDRASLLSGSANLEIAFPTYQASPVPGSAIARPGVPVSRRR